MLTLNMILQDFTVTWAREDDSRTWQGCEGTGVMYMYCMYLKSKPFGIVGNILWINHYDKILQDF